MGGKTQTTRSKVKIPAEIMARYNAVNKLASNTAKTPFQEYGTDPNAFVAGVNDQQLAGTDTINQAGGYYGQAADLMQQGAGTATPGELDVDKYMSPYINDVVNSSAALIDQNNEQAMAGQTGNAITSGAFGGDRAGIAAAVLQGQQGMARSKSLSDILQSGFSQAQGVAQQQQGVDLAAQQANLARYMQAGQGFAGLGQSQAALGESQLNAGTLQQQTDQAGKTALYQQFMQKQGYPFQVAQFLANIAMGTGALSGSTTTTTQPAPFFSDRRLKHDIKRIGKTDEGLPIYTFKYKGDENQQTHVGFMADEVEQVHPEAVGESQGFKTVDYAKATGKAEGGGVEGPYASTVGSSPYASSFVPPAYLNVSELMLPDTSAADQSNESVMQQMQDAMKFGESVAGMKDTFGTLKGLFGKAEGGEVSGIGGAEYLQHNKQDMPQPQSPLKDTLESQEKSGESTNKLVQAQHAQAQPSGASQVGAAAGGIGSLLSGIAGIFALSDKRVKHSVKRIGKTDNGMPIYTFKYDGDPREQTHVGFMAQEVEQKHPDAVHEINGLKHIDLSKAHQFSRGGYAEGGEPVDEEERRRRVETMFGPMPGMDNVNTLHQGAPVTLASSNLLPPTTADQRSGMMGRNPAEGFADTRTPDQMMMEREVAAATPVIPPADAVTTQDNGMMGRISPPKSLSSIFIDQPTAKLTDAREAPVVAAPETALADAAPATAENPFVQPQRPVTPTPVREPRSPMDVVLPNMADVQEVLPAAPAEKTVADVKLPAKKVALPAYNFDINSPTYVEDNVAFIKADILSKGGTEAQANYAAELARREGLKRGTWQANGKVNGERERSYSPFQLYMDGGLGNEFQNETKLDPRDPKNAQAVVDWADSYILKNGPSKWAASRKMAKDGITWDGPNNPNARSLAEATNPMTETGQKVAQKAEEIARDTGDTVSNVMSKITSNPDLLLSILSGLGAMASSPSRYLGSAILQGVGAGANTYAGLRKQSSDMAATNRDTLKSIAQQAVAMTLKSGRQVTMQDVANSIGYKGIIPDNMTPEAILGSYDPALSDDNLKKVTYAGYDQPSSSSRFGPDVKVLNSDDPEYLRAFVKRFSQVNDEDIAARVAQAQTRLDQIEEKGYTRGQKPDGQYVEVKIPEAVAAADRATTDAGNREFTLAFTKEKIEQMPQISGQLAKINDQKSIFQRLPAGALVTDKAKAIALLKAIGIAAPDVLSDDGAIDPALVEQAIKLQADQVVRSLNGVPGEATDDKMEQIRQMSGSPELQPEAIKMILAMKEAELFRQRDRYILRNKGEWKGSTDQSGYEEWFDKNHPFEEYFKASMASMPQFAGEAVPKSAAEVELERRGFKKGEDGRWVKP